MKNPPHQILALLFAGAMLTGCLGGGGSGSGGGGSGNGGDGNGGGGPGGPGDGGTPGDVIAPEDTLQFGRALMLDYTPLYGTGETDWATIEAAYAGAPDQQPQRMAVDVSMLGVALASALHATDRIFDLFVGWDDDVYDDTFHQVLGLQECVSGGTVDDSADHNSLTFNNVCFIVTELDDREIVLNGVVTWQENPGALWPAPAGEPTRLLEFQGFEVDWNGQRFVMNGALADEPSMASDPNDPDARPGGLLHMAWDATHVGGNRTYRFARRFNSSLVSSGAADTLAYHPELGAVATLLSESWYAGDTCSGGGIEDVAVRLSTGTLDDDLAVGLPGCDAYFFVPEFASANLDSSGIQIRPELYRLLASLGMADDSHTGRTIGSDQSQHYELAAQPGPTYLDPVEVDIGRIGAISDSSGVDTAYQVTLSFDVEDFLSLGLALGDEVAGVLRFHVANRGEDGGHSAAYFGGVSRSSAWSGTPTTGSIWVDHNGTDPIAVTGHSDHPWHAAIVTTTIRGILLVPPASSRLQMVVSTSADADWLIQDGEFVSGICLRESEDCPEELLPTLMVITQD